MTTQVNIDESGSYSATPDRVWSLVGDPGSIEAWLPPVTKSWMEGDVRHAELGVGGVARERITNHDAAGRLYDYEYVDGPMPLKAFTSRLAVEESGNGGSKISWTATFQADDAAEAEQQRSAVAGMYSSGLEQISKVLSSANA